LYQFCGPKIQLTQEKLRMKLQTFLAALALAGVSLLAGCGSPETSTAPPKATSADAEASVERILQPLPDSGFKAQITVVGPPAKIARRERADLTVLVKNNGDATWPMRGRAGDGIFQINLGDHWIDSGGKDVKVDERVSLPRALKPGEEVEMSLGIVADQPGDFTVEVDMVQEGVAWFAQKGSQPARFKIKVE
jgi:hypothetical protein